MKPAFQVGLAGGIAISATLQMDWASGVAAGSVLVGMAAWQKFQELWAKKDCPNPDAHIHAEHVQARRTMTDAAGPPWRNLAG
ncbi:hypothetical protein ACWZJV_05390 [Nocardioides sp. WG-D5]